MRSSKFKQKMVFLLMGVGFIILFCFFIKSIQYKKFYDSHTLSHFVFPYKMKKADEEIPFKIVSEFRGGPKKQGVAKGEFSFKGEAKQLWPSINGSLHGASKATPAVDNTGLYVGGDDGWFYKISHKGQLLWKTYFAKTGEGVHGTALLSQKYLWVGAYNGVLYCFKKQTGELVYTIDLGLAIGASPSFYKDQVIVSVELGRPARGYVAGLSAQDGSLKWKSTVISAHIHSSVAIHPEKGWGVTGGNNGFLLKIDLRSGKTLWIRQLGGAIKSTPLIYKNRIYVSHWGGYLTALGEDGRFIWEVNIKGRSQSSPTLIPGLEYLIFATHGRRSGKLWAVSATTGNIIWQKKISNKRAISSGLSFFSTKENRYLFLFPCSAKAICVGDPRTGNFRQKIMIHSLLTGSFAFFKDRFFLSANKGGLWSLR